MPDENTAPEWTDNTYRESITEAVFDASFSQARLTSLFKFFAYCPSLATISALENLNTSNVTDMSALFSGCISITSLDLSNFDTSNVKTMRNMFNNCQALTRLNISNLNTRNVTDMAYMFSHCQSLTSLDISRFNTSNVTTMRTMFQDCQSLTSLDVSGFNTELVTDMGYMFSRCQNITKLDIGNFNTSHVTNMSYMFQSCRKLISIDLSSLDTNAVTSMIGMFNNCMGLLSLDLSNFRTKNVQDMMMMFLNCRNLTDITFGKNFTALNHSNINTCENLKTVNAQMATPFTISSECFASTVTSNATLKVPAGTKTLYQTAEGWKEFWNIVEYDATTIKSTNTDCMENKPAIYDLNGHRMRSTHRKGLYIIGGKKIAM
ncbi:MAG: BspA family leucine-rich repeat surface protein [Bacteroidales bacterium]|nr:BspA family leucine-rich repeat surface protein [Bacteroidales bacterium]MCM1147611.1 BspA family leucine-rich repeat surface protein [Bacteroidales bacterium]MCM1206402.1 BspA family leucine-rich repeat surface protein [Bacillota bacterium]MCM1509136.1 BspA family leucine-rich repeat surface protein [Clostridium sp.]